MSDIDPIAIMAAIQGLLLRCRKLAASGRLDPEKATQILIVADAIEARTREVDRKNKI